MNLTDRELTRRAREGDNAAFSQLWARHEGRVVSLCRRYLAGPHQDPAVDAQDLASETYIRALHGLGRFEERSGEGGFEAWLLRVAQRACLGYLEKQRRRQQWLENGGMEPDVEGLTVSAAAVQTVRLVEEREVLRIAAQEINALPETYRLPFKLCLEEYSHGEIARTLGISAECAMQRVHRARRMLQPRLAALFGVAPKPSRRSRVALRSVEQALSEIVRDVRIVSITVPGGGEMQLCLRVDRRVALREEELASRRRRLERHPRAWKPFLEFADLCYHTGRWGEAREAYRSVLARNPGCFAAALRLGEMLREEGLPEEAAAIFGAALEQSPPPEIASRLCAERLEAGGEYEPAAAAYRAAIDLDPAERAGYYGLHRVLGRLSRYAEQLEHLAALRETAPDDLFGYDEAYTPCARLGRWEVALPLMERAVELDPNHPLALKHLFQVRMNQQRFDEETLALAERLVGLAPEFVESWSELAWIYSELDREEESLAVLRQFLSEHPASAQAHAALAWRCHYLGRTDELVFHALRAYALAPQDWHVCWTALLACMNGSPVPTKVERIRLAGEIADRFPDDAHLLRIVCSVYVRQGHEEEALACLQRLRDMQLAAADYLVLLADTLVRLRRWSEAAQEYRRLLALSGVTSLAVQARLGEALYRMLDPAAETVFAEANALARTCADFGIVADVYEHCGLYERAAVAAERAFCLAPPTGLLRRRATARLARLKALTSANPLTHTP